MAANNSGCSQVPIIYRERIEEDRGQQRTYIYETHKEKEETKRNTHTHTGLGGADRKRDKDRD